MDSYFFLNGYLYLSMNVICSTLRALHYELIFVFLVPGTKTYFLLFIRTTHLIIQAKTYADTTVTIMKSFMIIIHKSAFDKI